MSKTVIYKEVQYSKSSDLFDTFHEEGMGRDTAIITAVTSGMTLNTATHHYAAWAKSKGLTSVIVSHKSEALEFLAAEYPTQFNLDNVREALPIMVEKFSVAESTARDYAKAYCEQLGIEYPVINPRDAIFSWFKSTDSVTKEAFMKFATEELKRSQSNANEYWKGYELHLHLIAE